MVLLRIRKVKGFCLYSLEFESKGDWLQAYFEEVCDTELAD